MDATADPRAAGTRLPARRKLRVSFLVLVGLYLMLIGCGHLADRLILFPWTDPVDTRGARQELIAFQGGKLELWSARSPGARVEDGDGRETGPDAYVIYFPGNADRADRWVADMALGYGERRVEVVGMNYPAFGGSTGPSRLARIGPAGVAAYDAVRARAGERPIVIEASSLGTAVALHVAANRPVAGLALHNPPALRPIILGQHGWWNLWLLAGPIALQVPADLDSIANAGRVTAPAVFARSEHDEVVPPKYQQRVIDAYAGPKREVIAKSAMHNDAMDEAALRQLAEDKRWLWEWVERGARLAP